MMPVEIPADLFDFRSEEPTDFDLQSNLSSSSDLLALDAGGELGSQRNALYTASESDSSTLSPPLSQMSPPLSGMSHSAPALKRQKTVLFVSTARICILFGIGSTFLEYNIELHRNLAGSWPLTL